MDAFDVLYDGYRKEIECESWRFVFSVPADEVDVPFEPHPHVGLYKGDGNQQQTQ